MSSQAASMFSPTVTRPFVAVAAKDHLSSQSPAMTLVATEPTASHSPAAVAVSVLTPGLQAT